MEDNRIIKINGEDFPASEYQTAIFDFIMKGAGNLIINAAAGSAKTTTLINCIRFIPEDKKTLFVSFNKHIAATINKKVNNEKAKARTCSSVGFEICRENGIGNGTDAVNDEKYNDYLRENINSLTQYGEVKSLGRLYGAYMRNIRQLIDLCRYTLSFSIKEISALAQKYAITPIRDEIEVTREVLKWGERNTEMIDQTDMVWLPNVLNLETKWLKYDFIFIDEAQDISIAQQNLIMKCAKRGARIVAVGDRNQQINVWCGSDEQAIENLKGLSVTKELSLPICYRCGTSIIDYANRFSNDKMFPAEGAISGSVNTDVSLSEIAVGDMVLCRNMAPLIELQQTLFRRNQKTYIQGYKDIRENYVELIKSTHAKKIDRNCITKEGLFPQLYGMLLDEIGKLMTTMGMDEEEALSRPSVLTLYDNIMGIKTMSEGLETVDELIEKIGIIFSGDETDAILLSTVHRAKGLEADNVFIYLPSLLTNNRMAVKEWELKTERNLNYVAYTRPKKTLNFLKENWADMKNVYAGSKNFASAIKTIRDMINYNKDFGISENKIFTGRTVEANMDGMTVITSNQNGKKIKGGLKFCNLMKK